MLLELGSTALIVIDVQGGFVTAASAPVVPVIADVTARWQAAGGRTVFTRFVNAPGSGYVELIGWAKMMPGDPATEFVPEVARLAGRASKVVVKSSYSALTGDVVGWLESEGVRDVVLCGLDTESCVLITAHSAFDAGFRPWVLTDAVASHAGQDAHDAGLFVMGRNIGTGQLITTSAFGYP